MGAEFLVELATDFSQTHGTILKVAYAEILRYIIHPIANVSGLSFCAVLPMSSC